MIVLIRHGEATHHTERLTGGWTDSSLTPIGEKQLQLLANKLVIDFKSNRKKPIIISSDLKRAKTSADIIANALGIKEVQTRSFLREKNNGDAANMKEKDAKKLYKGSLDGENLDFVNYPGGETRRIFYNRTKVDFDRYINDDEDYILVSHKGTIQNIIFNWLGFDIQEVYDKNFSVDILPASISVLGINKWNEHCLFLLNDISHLNMDKGFGILKYKYVKKKTTSI